MDGATGVMFEWMSPFEVKASFVLTFSAVDKPIIGTAVGVFLSDSAGIGDTQNRSGLVLDISKTGVLARATRYEGVFGRPE